ncbi:cytochrome c [Shewanella sp. NIFS-20-20]|uniref:c-type cytochrome n=1 Tax=Shewanella sp. NIFS-20-20 TaxID=2853806 RepID=UPI001C44921A|nr:cytochrome c [Shewanella sp. NIFS-20-20]MBV7314207.1 cytochrome c [Shewanella sp. NIFS-20-20]
MKRIAAVLLSGLICAPVLAADNFKNNEDAIEYRQDAFGLIAYNFGDMGAMMKGKKPFDAAVFAVRAQNVAALSLLPAEGFIRESSQGDTGAKAEIWQDKAEFDAKMKQFQTDAANLAVVASAGNEKEIKQAFQATAKNCKACHDTFKKD